MNGKSTQVFQVQRNPKTQEEDAESWSFDPHLGRHNATLDACMRLEFCSVPHPFAHLPHH